MAYIEAHQSLRDHRKILALAAELDMEEAHVAGHCLFLWLWSLDNAEDGILPDSARMIERAAGWHGATGALVAAMVKAGMLDRLDDGRTAIHNWMDYAGRLIEKRKADTERKREERARKGHPAPSAPTSVVPSKPVRRTSDGHPTDGAGNVPNPNVTNLTQAEETPTVGDAPTADASEPPAGDFAPMARMNGHQSSSQPSLPERRTSDTTDRIYWTRILKEADDKHRLPLLVQLAHEKIGVPNGKGSAAYGRLGKLAKEHGAALLAGWILQAAAGHIDGDPLDYLTKIANGQVARASPRQNGHRPVTAATASRPILTADDAMPEGY